MARSDDGYAASRGAQLNRKTQQLCKQVERVVAAVLAECGEERLHELALLGVEPACGSSVLRVAVFTPSSDGAQLQAIRDALERARPFVRSQVAQAICRKRAPELVFALIPA